MTQTIPRHPDPLLLRRFSFLDGLSEEQIELLARSLVIRRACARSRLVELGSTADFSLLLLHGRVALVGADHSRRLVSAGDDFAPLAPELPRRYDVVALTQVLFLQIDNSLLADLRRANEYSPVDLVDAVAARSGDSGAKRLLDLVRGDLARDRLELPSLPDVAFRIGRALDDEAGDAHHIAEIIQTDPAITAKLLWVSNSAFYAGRRRFQTCADAVVRLGVRTTHKLVLSFALREVFRTGSPLLESRMRELWRHSVQVAATCFVLARHAHRFDPEEALLAGLVHDIGEVAVLSYAARLPAAQKDPSVLAATVEGLRAEAGAVILSKWEFPAALVACAREAEDWGRDHAPTPDYCDLVLVAQLQGFVGTERMRALPNAGDLPCYRKLDLGEITPELGLKILEESADQLAQVEAMLAA